MFSNSFLAVQTSTQGSNIGTSNVTMPAMHWFLPLVLLANPALAQNFVDETDLRFPTPGPEEYTNQVDMADVDNDGDLDLFFANGNGYVVAVKAEQSRLYINNGSGVFSDETTARIDLGPAYVRDADFGDVNGDGWTDLILAGAFGDPPRLLINDGSGSYNNQTLARFPAHDGSWGCAVTVGDVDLDGDLDLYFTNVGEHLFKAPGGQDRLYLNDGKGFFADVTDDQLPKLITRASLHAEFADVDNDGDLDILVGNREAENNLLINDGKGFFLNESSLLAADGKLSQQISAGTLDSDALPDLFIVNGQVGNQSPPGEQILINGLDGGAGFVDLTSQLMPINGGGDDSRFLLHDVDNDGDWDVIIAGLSPGQERVLLNNGEGTMTPATSSEFKGPADTTLDLAMGDLNGDGQPDVVTAQGESGQFRNRIYIKKGTKGGHPKIDLVTPRNGVIPYIAPIIISARVQSGFLDEGASHVKKVQVNNQPMLWSGHDRYTGFVGQGLITSPVVATLKAMDRSGHSAPDQSITLTPRHPLDVFQDGLVNDDDLNIMIGHLIDKGGLGSEGDINNDGDTNLSDAQLLASGLAGFPVLSHAEYVEGHGLLVLGSGFKAGMTVTVDGSTAKVIANGEFSLLCEATADSQSLVIEVGGHLSNTWELTP
ncbi:MAG TPA: hypothetical protein EYN06_05900 [Myxococcales bacterium]|nr:hypothetical protein [Myxococcales bacterium]HIN85997.1 hypothetical protein [Myxococcales bacterium]